MGGPAANGVLVIGYGNDLRGEDCAGRLAAESISQWDCPDVEAMSLHQLGPELAWNIAASRLVIFVDAFAADLPIPEMVDRPGIAPKPVVPVQFKPRKGRKQPLAEHPVLIKLRPTVRDISLGHASDPVTLLLLSRELCGRSPQAYMVGIPARRFGIGDELTEATKAAIIEAVDLIKMLSLWKLRTMPIKSVAVNQHLAT